MAETPLMRMIDEGVVNADDIFTPEAGILAAQTGAMMMPGSGLLDAAGYAFDMPSIGENIYQGNFGDAALQGAGLLGDMMYAAAPFTAGATIPVAASLKGMRAARTSGSELSPNLINIILTEIDRNPKKVAKELRQRGLLDVEASGDFVQAFKDIKEVKRSRALSRSGVDPLVADQRLRDMRLQKYKKEKKIKQAPIFRDWSKTFKDRVLASSFDRQLLNSEAKLATLDAISREAKKRGLKVYHTSKSKSQRASSRYVQLPSGAKVRISDHPLPDTAEREFNRSRGIGNYADEIIVDDWDKTTLDEYLNMIINADQERF